MAVLLLGILIWWGAHFFKRLMPEQRARLGEKGKGLVALALVAAIVLMVLGYRSMEFIYVWAPPSFMVHINNTLVLIALFLMSPAPKKGALLNGMRHPMLTGFALWAIAHLLVNGDLASIILFGGLLAYVPVQIMLINRAEPTWAPGPKGSYAKDGMFFVASIILMGVIGYIHGLVGPSPFGG
ncbi:NnrU family protein [Phaeobacter italicus]|uniref:NnrU family protein n=1 Tax=Phaeobacter italicus TaxID=481446 RepID=UPI001C957CE6|nr:NnrU family protein [Phaeobacter italicus]MBY5976007.1 NnrU family protein [Phaeobacter italicus]